MKIQLLAFTQAGFALAQMLAEGLNGQAFRCGKGCTLSQWTKENFCTDFGLVFVGAAGIAVRAIAPHIKHKTTDPAVVVVDEGGQFVIPILSGHLGGANDLARSIAQRCGGTPVITTATDVNGLFSVDQWARVQGLWVENPAKIKEISAGILNGETISIYSDYPIWGTPPRGIVLAQKEDCDVCVTAYRPTGRWLKLIPKVAVLGVGCRRGTSKEHLEQAFYELLAQENMSAQSVYKVCSIDLKGNEDGLLAFCNEHNLPFETYSAQALSDLEGEFTSSAFVQQVTGVDNVCQRSAVLGSGGGTLLGKKYQNNGVTMALALRDFTLSWRCGHG